MYENLPQLSQAVRDTIGLELHEYARLEEAEKEKYAEEGLERLKAVNHFIGNAIDAIVFPLEDLREDCEEEAWRAATWSARTFILEAVLVLLGMIDQALWAESMSRRAERE